MFTAEEYAESYTNNFEFTKRYLLKQGCNADLAEEVAQHAWARAWEKKDQFKGTARIDTWVATIARNAWFMYFRKLGGKTFIEINPTHAIFEPFDQIEADLLIEYAERKRPEAMNTVRTLMEEERLKIGIKTKYWRARQELKKVLRAAA